MKVLDVAGTGVAKVAAGAKRVAEAVAAAVSGAEAQPLHHCDGFHCDCERRAEVAAESREVAGAWLSGRSGWLKR